MKHKPEIHVIDPNETHKQLVIHSRVGTDHRATLATDLLKMGMAAQVVPMEETNLDGSQKYRFLTPSECAERAILMVEEFYKKCAERDWIFEMPPYEALKLDREKTGF